MADSRQGVIYGDHDDIGRMVRHLYRVEQKIRASGNRRITLPAMIWGDPGCGKTTTIRDDLVSEMIVRLAAIGKRCGYWNVNLATQTAEDIGGYPIPNREKNFMDFLVNGCIPFWDGKPEDAPYGILVLDDVDRAQSEETLKAAMSLLLAREVNGHTLSPNVYVCGTANGESDAGKTVQLGEAFANRCVHLYLRPGHGWTRFFNDPAITEIEGTLPIRKTDFEELAYASPRSIEMALAIIDGAEELPEGDGRKPSRSLLRKMVYGTGGCDCGSKILKMKGRAFTLRSVIDGTAPTTGGISLEDIDLLAEDIRGVRPEMFDATVASVQTWLGRIEDDGGRNAIRTAIAEIRRNATRL
jgi:hypothetical protein